MGTLVADIWTNGTRTLTGAGLSSGSLATLSDVQTASSSLTSQINSNTNTQTSAVTTAVNANTDAKILTATTSLASVINANTESVVNTATTSIVSQLGSSFAAIPANVWGYSGRTLTSLSAVASDIWDATTRTLTSITLSSQSPWSVGMSDFGTISAGDTYRSTVTTIYNGSLSDSANIPTITVYDPNRNVVVNAAPMTRTSTGTYEYAYTTSVGATGGVWESVVSATVETGKTLPGNDYWNVTTAPPQVIILDMNSTIVPNISANVRITNEGDAPYEYQYEWCIVTNQSNSCGGGDDTYYASAAKLINPGDNFDTTLTATVSNPGTYYFKVAVYYGTEKSGSSRQFVATSASSPPPSNGGGGGSVGGGGGGGGVAPTVNTANVISATGACSGADFNHDKKVNTVDFSILLAFWKTTYPFKNPCVDINGDKKVNTIDFSILLSQWGTVGLR